MPKIFISYRRDDSAYPAQSIHETLVAHFGESEVFIDVDNIPFGVDFYDHLNEAVAQCDILLAVIGDGWLNAEDGMGGRRLDNPDDFVRIEIEAALSRKIPVVPVLVGKASVPHATELPDTLSHLARRNAAEVRPGRDFRSHLDRLARGIEHSVNEYKQRSSLQQNREQIDLISPQPLATITKPDVDVSKRGLAYIVHTATRDIEIPKVVVTSKAVDYITSSTGIRMKSIPAGGFMMGSRDSDTMASSYERPEHLVEIATPFHLGAYPVTQAEYQEFMGDNPSHFAEESHRPVEGIRWLDAVAFCNKLSEVEKIKPFYRISGEDVSIVGGNGYRLPTEAEWEYACRAGTTTKWYCGDDESQLEKYAWYDDHTTHTVGEKKPNPWGLHDMHGNVWEWCWDWFDTYEDDSHQCDPKGPKWVERRVRVLRGGSFNCPSSEIRSAHRYSNDPRECWNAVGFRLARSPLEF